MAGSPFRAKARSRCIHIAIVISDLVALALSIWLSLLLRFENLPWNYVYDQCVADHLASLAVGAIVYFLSFSAFRLYKCVWRFASLEMLWNLACANTVAVSGLIVSQVMIDGSIMPRSVLIMIGAANILLTGIIRVLLRITSIKLKHNGHTGTLIDHSTTTKRIVILGAGSDGVSTFRAIKSDPDLKYDIIGFLDDNPKMSGIYIGSTRVIGPISVIRELAETHSVDEIIVALPETIDESVRECIMECRKRKIPIKKVPQLKDVLIGKTSLKLVDFSVEDLLRRPVANTNVSDIAGYLTGKRVLVTGAGGSIGSELCRQIAKTGPDSLVLLGHGENSIHQIYQELTGTFPELAESIHSIIASVANRKRVTQVFDHYKPQVVFHAAAHKHVPIMENNEVEAIFNNVQGTKNIAEICGRCKVEKMVQISTDKAADPMCVMGATKWVCEQIMRAMSKYYKKTSYITVRFGNVLGSRGSVVPAFRQQIGNGGPLTVTHPEMTRFFMTIPEAVKLVLQSGASGESGALYILDMGKPVRITDLAEDMIRLCGFEPGSDIKICYTGVRPGERLHEQITSSTECIAHSSTDGIFLVHRPNHFCPDAAMDMVDKLIKHANKGDTNAIRTNLKAFIAQGCTSEPEDLEKVEPAAAI